MTSDLIQAAKDYLATTDGITEGEWDVEGFCSHCGACEIVHELEENRQHMDCSRIVPASEADLIAMNKTPIARQLILDLALQLTILSKQMETSVYSLWQDEIAKNRKLHDMITDLEKQIKQLEEKTND